MHRPFTILEEWVKQGRIRLTDAEIPMNSEAARAGAERPIVDLSPGPSDSEIFEASMQDVRPLEGNEGPARMPEPIAIRSNRDEEEALRALEEFCRNGRVETEHTCEYVEHVAHPLGVNSSNVVNTRQPRNRWFVLDAAV